MTLKTCIYALLSNIFLLNAYAFPTCVGGLNPNGCQYMIDGKLLKTGVFAQGQYIFSQGHGKFAQCPDKKGFGPICTRP